MSWGFNTRRLRPSQSNPVCACLVWPALRPSEPLLAHCTPLQQQSYPSRPSSRSPWAYPSRGELRLSGPREEQSDGFSNSARSRSQNLPARSSWMLENSQELRDAPPTLAHGSPTHSTSQIEPWVPN